MGNQFLSLGLFIMLLAFFIVLNSLSTFEQSKTTSVLKSLAETFVVDPPLGKDQVSEEVAAPGQDYKQGDALDRVQGLFQSVIPDAKANKNRFGTQLTMQMSVVEFETALGSNAPDNNRFANALSGLLYLNKTYPYEVDIYLNIEEDPAMLQRNEPVKATQYRKQISSYAATMEAGNIDPRLMTMGVKKGETKTITLIFRRYTPIQMELVPS